MLPKAMGLRIKQAVSSEPLSHPCSYFSCPFFLFRGILQYSPHLRVYVFNGQPWKIVVVHLFEASGIRFRTFPFEVSVGLPFCRMSPKPPTVGLSEPEGGDPQPLITKPDESFTILYNTVSRNIPTDLEGPSTQIRGPSNNTI